jgi:hypothetical protein
MTSLLKLSCLCLFLLVLNGCSNSLARFDRTYRYRVNYYTYQSFEGLRKQIDIAQPYHHYNHGQLSFIPYDTHAGNGLYFAAMPGKKTNYVVFIPCLITPDTSFINISDIEERLTGDTIKFKASVSNALHSLLANAGSWTGTGFSQAEIDSLQKTFLRGPFIHSKPGYYLRHPVY